MAKENFSLSDAQYDDLKIKCFQPWLSFESHENLLEILCIIQQSWSIHAALTVWRLIKSVPSNNTNKVLKKESLSTKFRYWINEFN